VCYLPIRNTQVGDELQFDINGGHNLYKMASSQHYEECDFTDGLLLHPAGQALLYKYTIDEQDKLDGRVFFACEVGSHCMGQQKLEVGIFPLPTDSAARDTLPTSEVVIGLSAENCVVTQKEAAADDGTDVVAGGPPSGGFGGPPPPSGGGPPTGGFGGGPPSGGAGDGQRLQSECSEPLLQEDNKTYFVSCLSPPATMTPGGVINNLFLLHYPYPTDRRVALGLRMWEFVADNSTDTESTPSTGSNLQPVPINQLYIHHLSGRVVLGQGTEGVRRSEPDAPFPAPYAAVTGDEGDLMIFHLIDLREVDDWLPCLECRCRDPDADGTYLNGGTADETGGINCCTNCTSLEGPTIDYRMRYNVSYYDIIEGAPIKEVQMITADISPAVGKNLEYDVPSQEFLPQVQQKTGVPWVQRLERTMPFNELFQMEFFGDKYQDGTNGAMEDVTLLRCVAHLHIASMGMWLIDAVTNETLCEGVTQYGTNPAQDKGFLKAVHVDTYAEPKVFPASRPVTLIADYNATEVHTGVMGMYFLFVEGSHGDMHASETPLVVDLCQPATCDWALLPFPFDEDEDEDEMMDMAIDIAPKEGPPGELTIPVTSCEDTLQESPACRFGNICDCETLVNAPETTEGGCDDGVYVTPMGNITVNVVCANYCGCPPAIIAVPVPPTAIPVATCEDTLSESPACRFGNICDCDTLVNAPETTEGGCDDGVYVTPMGNITVNVVCANYCGCPAINAPPTSPTTGPTGLSYCANALLSHPACRFGGVCDCETVVNAPESTGCGGVYSLDSSMGDLVVNDVCQSYCNDCPPRDNVQHTRELVEYMEDELRRQCKYATTQCRATLSNLYGCGVMNMRNMNATNNTSTMISDHPLKQAIVSSQGQMLALKHAKLGSANVHRGDNGKQDQTVEVCHYSIDGDEVDATSSSNADEDDSAGSSFVIITSSWFSIAFTGTLSLAFAAIMAA
jgi:hypothetical protein